MTNVRTPQRGIFFDSHCMILYRTLPPDGPDPHLPTSTLSLTQVYHSWVAITLSEAAHHHQSLLPVAV